MTLCVYALAAPPDTKTALKKSPLTGIGGERLRALTVGRVAAVVGELPRAPKPTERALREYALVQQALAGRLSATVPARFATCFDGGDELMLTLRSRQQTFRRSLQSVRGRAQMTVRIVNAQPPTPEVARILSGPRGEADKARPTGTAYLKARAAAQDVAEFAPVREAVRGWVRDERVERRGRLASVYHLVPRGSVPAYRRALAQAALAAGLRVVVSGPWPPYAFSTSF